MRPLLTFLFVATFAAGSTLASETPVFGRVQVAKDCRLVSACEVRSVVTVERRDCDKSPGCYFQPLPVYPSSLARVAVVGEAVVSFTVGDDGEVQDVKVEKSSANEFGAASAGAVVNWKFIPGEKEKKPVSVRLTAKFTFSMFDEDGG
jgi:TonB family protein